MKYHENKLWYGDYMLIHRRGPNIMALFKLTHEIQVSATLGSHVAPLMFGDLFYLLRWNIEGHSSQINLCVGVNAGQNEKYTCPRKCQHLS